MSSSAYKSLWKVVDGAVKDALMHNQHLFNAAEFNKLRESIDKRVTGSLISFVSARAKGK